MIPDQSLRQHVLYLLDMQGAHLSFDDAVADFPEPLVNTFPPSVPYTCWHLLEHLHQTYISPSKTN